LLHIAFATYSALRRAVLLKVVPSLPLVERCGSSAAIMDVEVSLVVPACTVDWEVCASAADEGEPIIFQPLRYAMRFSKCST